MSGKNDYEKNKTYWLRRAGLLPDEPAPVVETPQRSLQAPSHGDPPKCERCGGTPKLGRCGPEGGIRSLCYGCADEEYLEMLTPEQASLLRR